MLKKPGMITIFKSKQKKFEDHLTIELCDKRLYPSKRDIWV